MFDSTTVRPEKTSDEKTKTSTNQIHLVICPN